MRLALAAVVAAPLVAAFADDAHHHVRHIQHARQASPASSSSPAATQPAPTTHAATTSTPAAPPPPPAPTTSNPPPPPAPNPTGSPTAAAPPPGTTNAPAAPPSTVSISVSLASTNPTAVPLASINASAASAATSPLANTPAAGAQPTFIPGAPGLPNIATLNPALYPPLDKIPDTSSPEVQQWIQEVQNSGITIPGFSPTVAGGCPANQAAAADTSRCWWTCGGCVREADITECPTAKTWGLTYDDGPAFYTTQLLDYLDQANLKSTFFVVGSRVISFPAILQAEYMAQHQIAVHTWSHPSLTTLTNEQIIAELGWTKKAIKDVLGVTPNMMRPPFGDIDDRVRAISLAMGLVPVMWTRISPTQTFDTGDFEVHGGTTTVQQVLSNWDGIMNNVTSRDSGFIVLEHDLFQQTVEIATGYILPDAQARGLSIQPVTTCLKRPIADAYIETNNNQTNPPPAGFGNSSSSTGGGSSGSGAVPSLNFGTAAVLTTFASVFAGLLSIF